MPFIYAVSLFYLMRETVSVSEKVLVKLKYFKKMGNSWNKWWIKRKTCWRNIAETRNFHCFLCDLCFMNFPFLDQAARNKVMGYLFFCS